ncbi:MAG: hypothetical protein WC461_00800 [Candidatus Paceibacterota bacterium]
MEKTEYKIGLLGIGGKFKIENGFFSYKYPYGRNFRVPTKDIETVTVDVFGFGRAMLKIIGHGTVLASEKMPISWAHKCQAWILENK